MSGFDLVPVDGRVRVHLPPGETVLGRGPLLDISDTRVSRRHGLLENLNGQLRLKPTHVNPCFVQSSLSDDPRPLEKGSWFRLHHADLFSLLPGRFIYRVEAVGREERTPRNSQNFQEEEDELPVSAEPDVGQEQKQTSPPSAAQSEADRHFSQNNSTWPVEDVQCSVLPSEPRRRVLPAWMMTAAPTTKLKAVKRSKQPAALSTTQAPPTPTSLPEEAELSEEEERRPRKKRRKMNNKEEKQETETDDPPAWRSKVSKSKVSMGGNASTQSSDSGEVEDRKLSDSGELEDRTLSDGGEAEDRKLSDGGEAEDRKLSDGGEAEDRKLSDSGEAEDRKLSDGGEVEDRKTELRVRTPCPYGTDCYRKNPLHFQEFCHPGDPDHQEDQDRPECPYGTDCYRKNPLHRKQFRHTQEAARWTRAKKVPDEDEDDFEDEDSEDVGEDSDYVPLNSEDSDQEVFLKKRK